MILTEGNLRFNFSSDRAIKFDDTLFYRNSFNPMPGAKGVDFICDSNDFLLFLEVKDCLGREAENRWRIAPNNEKRDSIPSSTDKSDRDSLDIEVSHKVAMTISCLLGAQTYREKRITKAEELIPYVEALEDCRIAQRSKPLYVVLLLEGDFGSQTRNKAMIMYRIQQYLEKKLKWLNCRISVEDTSMYSKRLFSIERIE